MVPRHGEDVALRALNAVGASFVGIVLVVIGAIFDRERRRAQELAAAREAELVEAVRAAEAAAEARTTFLANMSHEIRTPMNGVLGLARVLVDEAEAPAQRELAQTILASGQGLLHILDDILDLSKLDAGALHMAPAPTQPRALIEEVRRLMRVKADEARLWLDVDVAEPLPPWVAIDGHRVRQVLTNLLGNAIKFTERGGVTIRASHGAGRLRVAVEDTGIGMTPEGLARAFRPFEQADGSTARRFGGTGLGLAICRRLCELMGGEVWARSAPGAGSTFTFEVAAPLAEAPVGAEPPALAPPSSARVLVAEDNRVNQLVARRLLAKLGAEVEVVTNGREAVEILHREPFDLVLMDLQMPEVDGLEATRRIRAMSGARSSTPIFALTASAMEKERRACAAAGMDGVLTKPIEIDALGRTLAALGAP
jgi:signal transduction histidine kinase/CheY-like chemotaxis protein